MKLNLLRLLSVLALAGSPLVASEVIINEIMYHPASQDVAEEYIELHNGGAAPVDLSGWRFVRGVSFTFPAGTIIPPGGYLAVAADLVAFEARYPQVNNVVGEWIGTLANGGETLELVDAVGVVVDRVDYADEGDWGTRRRGAPDLGYRGWDWFAEHDPDRGQLGASLELRNPRFSNDYGRNWGPSTNPAGSPGAQNSLRTFDVPPVILNVKHFPVVPTSADPVTVTCRVDDENPDFSFVSVSLFSRTASGLFVETVMFDDGLHNDGVAGDRVYGAILPAQPNNTVVEFYVRASDGDNVATWPAAALDEFGVPVQAANCHYQVDESLYSGSQAVFRLVMTVAEELELRNINRNSNARMNATLITVNGAETKVRYNVGVRIRGAGSRGAVVPNYRVSIPSDNKWNGVDSLNLNAQYGHSQVAGAAIVLKGGLQAANARPIQVRVNGVNFASAGAVNGFGSYALVEVVDSDWAENHVPRDSAGNVYICRRPNTDLSYLGTNAITYASNGYGKGSNSAEDDWTDLIELTFVLNETPNNTYVEEVRRVVNVEQWMTYLAMNTLLGNGETSLGTGVGDDYDMYRGVNDTRFIIVQHDLDTILAQGQGPAGVGTDIFRATRLAVLNRFMNRPEFLPIYYRELKRLIDGVLSPGELNPLLDRVLGDYVPAQTIDSMKQYALDRNAFVLSQIPLNLTINTGLQVVGGYPRATSSTISLNGEANAIDTRSVLVNGASATWNPRFGTWSINGVTLSPGLNRLLVQSVDGNGMEVERGWIEVWYDDSSVSGVSGTIGSDATWTAAGGPYSVSGVVVVPVGVTLTVEAGTTVFFEQGAGLEVSGRLVAEGSELRRIYLTRRPGTTVTWGGVNFLGSNEDNRITYTTIDFANSGDSLSLVDSTLFADHVVFANTTRTLIELDNSSLTVRNSVFPDLVGQEHIHGGPMPAGGHVIIDGNEFGTTTGLNDIIDFSGAQRPGPVVQILNNVFTGASDDVLDLDGTDAHVEGNVFMHVHNGDFADPDTSSAISFGQDGGYGPHVVAVRNLFYDVDHVALVKEGGFLTLENNTGLGVGVAILNFSEPERGTDPGAGAFLDGNVFWNPPEYTGSNFQNRFPANGTVDLVVHRTIFPALDGLTNGVGNLNIDPLLVNAHTNSILTVGDVRAALGLTGGSPAVGTGPNGLDRGAMVPEGASISGEPERTTHLREATLAVAGPGILSYRFDVNGGGFGAETSVTNPIVLTGLGAGDYTVSVLGRNSAGVEQSAATLSKTWTVVDAVFESLVINEVLARNNGLEHEDTFPDQVELYNAGGATLNLSGMGLTDRAADPYRFIFPLGTLLGPGEYLVLFGDAEPTSGFHLGFGLNQNGDSLFLFNSLAAGGGVVDSIQFGLQLADLSIGRRHDGSWGLNRPTFGARNVPLGTSTPLTLKINEWLADAQTLFQADFIEIYNPQPAPVALGGLFLSDEPLGHPTDHEMAALSFIGPFAHLILIPDGNTSQGANHLDFKLAPEQGRIGLLAPDRTVIDCISYGPQFSDVSEGRRPSGADAISFFGPMTRTSPTPGAPNPGQGGISTVTNIIRPVLDLAIDWRYERSGVDQGTAWRESDFDDSGWPVGPALLGVEGSALPPPGLNTFFGGYNNDQIPYYFRTTFDLQEDLGDFELYANTIIDDGAVIYLNGTEILRIRMPGGAIGAFTQALSVVNNASLEAWRVPGDSLVVGQNVLAVEVHQANIPSSDIILGVGLEGRRSITNFPDVLVVVNEVLANNASVPAPGDTNITDWIELHNPSEAAANLSGMSLSDDLANPRRWVFPPGVTLSAGAYLVVRSDGGAPASTNAQPVLNTGFGLSAGGDAVYLFDRPSNGGALLDSIVFGLQAEDFSIGRIPDSTGGWALNLPTPAARNLASVQGDVSIVVINEWMANPSGDDDDYFELFNPNPLPVDIGGLFLTDDLLVRDKHKIAALSFIGVGDAAFAVFFADGNPQNGADHVDFGLSRSGESLGVFFGNGAAVDSLTFGSQDNGVSEGRFPDGSPNIRRFDGTATPGGSNILPLSDIVINEVLTHTDPPFEDAIELFNPSQRSIDISGWWLSDSRNQPKKFRIPDGTVLEPGAFVVFYEYQFNPDFTGRSPGFGLSSVNGDDVVLSTADPDGNLTGFRARARFRPSERLVSFGTYETSVETHFVSLRERTFGVDDPPTTNEFRMGGGLPNALPKVGPVVISEIMYHPRDISGQDNTVDEYIELHNTSGTAVDLFDVNFPTNTWRLRDAVDYEFPMGTTLAAGGHLIVIGFSPTNDLQLLGLKIKFGIPDGIPIFGPWRGQLSNSDDDVELYKPDAPQPIGSNNAGFVPYVLVEAVDYEDAAPWPSAADGDTNSFGLSLQRRVLDQYGNDPVNWLAGPATGGRPTGPALVELPSIVVQPQDLTVPQGGTINLTSQAAGAGPLTYQWRFNGADIPGQISPSLILPGATVANGGVYSVRVNNVAGTVLSDRVLVTIEAPPMITDQPRTLVVVAGESARFTVGAAGTPPLMYQWFLDGAPLSGATRASLLVADVQPANEGEYTVQVSNAFGSTTSAAAGLFINTPPSILTHPQGMNVFVGSNVVFQVVAAGSPPLRYQWRRNGLVLPGETGDSLNLSNVQVGDSANYQVQVINPVGSILSNPAQLNVLVPPTLSLQVVDRDASEPGPADTAQFNVLRSGATNLEVTVNFSISGEALPGSDYVALVSPLIIPAGAVSVPVVVTVLDDGEAEGDETVALTLLKGDGYLLGASISDFVIIHDEDNTAPAVSITEPGEGAIFSFPVDVLVRVAASDGDGSIVRVELFAEGTNLIGQASVEPFEILWRSAPAGDHTLTAVAVDNLGSTGFSAPVSIRVNSDPVVALTSPADGASFGAPAEIPLIATASDPGGAITLVEFFESGNLIGSSTMGSDPTLRADYQFAGSRASSVGAAPALTDLGANEFVADTVDGQTRTVLSFAENDGLSLGPVASVIPNDIYTVVMLFRFEKTDLWRRILGFKDGLSDSALYAHDGTLEFFPVDEGPGPTLVPNSYSQVVLTRDETGNLTGYVDGVQQFSFLDGDGLGSLAGSSTLRFFRDNDSEASGGRVARVRVFDRALSAAEVLALDRLPAAGSGGMFSLTLTNVPLGTYTYTARATDDLGATVTSEPITVFVNPPMANFSDNFADRGEILGVTNFVIGDNSTYTRELGEPQHDNRNGGHSAWITWTAVGSGTCTIDTFGSGFDTVLAVYTGESLTSLFRVASNDDFGRRESRVQFQAEGGVSYQIAVDGFGFTDRGMILMHLFLETVAPMIVAHPVDATVNPGAQVSFTVVATGGMPLIYQWQFNGVDIPGANSATFTLPSAGSAAEGEYRVVVSNGMGTVTSDAALLTVRVRPTVTEEPADLVVNPGEDATFSVTAVGTPVLGYQWRFNGAILSGETADALTVADVDYADGGFYQVIVANAIGATISAPAELIVRPRLVSVVSRSNGDLELTFNGVPGKSYVIEGRTDHGLWVDLGTSTLSGETTQGVFVDSPGPGVVVRLYRLRLVEF